MKPGCDKLLDVDWSPLEGSKQAVLVALEHTIQFNPSMVEINAR
jgi:hypothetical protein